MRLSCIQSKSKPCRGQGIAKGFGCGKPTEHRKYGLGKSCCLPSWYLTTDNGKVKLAKATFNAKKETAHSKKIAVQTMKEAVTDWKKNLQKKINQIAREIDFGQLCTAKQNKAGKWDAGHVFARGSWTSMRYNLHNIYLQGAQSNYYGNDDGLMRDGIARIGGEEYLDFVTSLKSTPPLKFKDWEYQAIYRSACKIYREMEKGVIRSDAERINMRNEINLLLGIYQVSESVFTIPASPPPDE